MSKNDYCNYCTHPRYKHVKSTKEHPLASDFCSDCNEYKMFHIFLEADEL